MEKKSIKFLLPFYKDLLHLDVSFICLKHKEVSATSAQ